MIEDVDETTSAVTHSKPDGTPQPMTPAEIAAVCHAANREYRSLIGEDSGSDWESASHFLRTSIIKGVQGRLATPHQTPRESHEAWFQHYTDNGWTHGPVKDESRKQHPCLLPYEQLPVAQRRKDLLFTAIVRALSTP